MTAQAPLGGPAHGWRLRTASVAAAVDSARVFQALYGRSRQAFWLDSSRAGQGRFSYLGDASGPHREVLIHRVGAERSAFDVLADRLAARALPADPELPFDLCGGYVGYLGYELKGELPGVRNRHRSALPDAVWMAADRYLVVDHEESRLWAVALCRSSSREDTEAADRWIATSLERALTADASTPLPLAAPAPPAPPARIPPGTDLAAALARPRDRYLADVEECRRLLRQGESYEICLTGV